MAENGQVDFALEGARIFVAGHNGMVGSALMRRLEREDCTTLVASRDQLDLRDQAAVDRWMGEHRPDVVLIAAATVGGILANQRRPASFLYDNLMIEANLIEAARVTGVRKLLFLGSSCIYPEFAPQPIREEALLTGLLDPTNEAYAIAKIAGVKLCRAYRRQYECDFISAMPCNLYGPNDDFDLQTSHVVAALMAKIHAAVRDGHDTVEIWGTGKPRREFLHVDDLADACLHLLRHYSGDDHVNVGTGSDVTINDLAALIAGVVGFDGRFVHRTERPDGTPRKLVDVSRLTALGWTAGIGLREGLQAVYDGYLRAEKPVPARI